MLAKPKGYVWEIEGTLVAAIPLNYASSSWEESGKIPVCKSSSREMPMIERGKLRGEWVSPAIAADLTYDPPPIFVFLIVYFSIDSYIFIAAC